MTNPPQGTLTEVLDRLQTEQEKRVAGETEWLATVPPGESGDVVIDRFTCTREEARHYNAMALMKGRREHMVAGTYTRLHVGRVLMMTDTPDERRGHRGFVERAHGRVLVGGLGIGMVLNALLAKPAVEHVTVLEKNPHVVALVGPHYAGNPRVSIVQADVFEWRPPEGLVFDAVWHDVWPSVSADNLNGMTRLRRRYKKWVRSGRVDDVECWERAMCQYLARNR